MQEKARIYLLEDFSPLVGTAFRLDLGERERMDLVLVETRDLGTVPRPQPPEPGTRTRAFSVHFRGPKTPVLPQKTYVLAHESLGALSIFIVPIGPDGAGMRYEAIFN